MTNAPPDPENDDRNSFTELIAALCTEVSKHAASIAALKTLLTKQGVTAHEIDAAVAAAEKDLGVLVSANADGADDFQQILRRVFGKGDVSR